MSEPTWHTVTVTIPLLSEEHARIAKQVLDVDRELQPHAVKRVLEVQGNNLIAKLSTLTIRLARLSTNAFLENIDLIVHTLDEFGTQ
ncbi:transcription factor Pcc1 [Thelephora ganbajun]|uniref:Transcription factor Pcc1 n=1 Tax=Thelephora ganbajun TaxID=370292 RepID=A0ACB6ZCA6_THEGA|nr:transcription factor Pcc1 [Thelephora ganbajun]